VFKEHRIEWNDEQVGRLWDWYAKTRPYCDMYFAKLFGEQIVRATGFSLNAGISVLDFGCGPGFLWDHIRALQCLWRYTGIDFSRVSVATLVRRAVHESRFAGALHVRSLPVDLPDAAFDAAFMIEVVEHISDDQLDAALAETRRLLKPGGKLVITTPNDEDLSLSTKFCPDCGSVFHEWQHVRSWSAASLSASVARRGFTPHRVEPWDFYANSWLRTAFNTMRRFVYGRSKPHLLGVFTR